MMRPRKAKELIPSVAEQQGLPTKTVEDIVNFYWREVWGSLTTGQGIKVHVTNLGDFNIKHWLLDKEIHKMETYVANYDATSKLRGAQKYTVKLKAEDKLQSLKAFRYMYQEEQQRKEFIYEHKKTRNETPEEEFIAGVEG